MLKLLRFNPDEAMNAEEFKQVVTNGYEQMGTRFAGWAEGVRQNERRKYLKILLDLVPEHNPVLELGCGPGGEVTQALARRFTLTGIDISPVQIALAQAQNPGAEFHCADMVHFPLQNESFSAVAAFYSLFHLPRHEQVLMLEKIIACLSPGGIFVGCFGTQDIEIGWDEDFLGVTMVSSSFAPGTLYELIRKSPLVLKIFQVEYETEFEREIPFLWVVAQKPE